MVMHDQSDAYDLVQRQIGSVDVLIDILRQFAVFQDHLGSLTDVSLVGLHAVMLSIQKHSARNLVSDKDQ